jgi:hypothetical protein
MYKSILHISLSIVLLLNGMAYSVIQLDFSLNRERIAELLCINQDKTELSCNGQCELTRRLDTAQEQKEGQKTFVQEEISLVYTLPDPSHTPVKLWYHSPLFYRGMDESNFVFLNFAEFFHPPQD